MNLFQLPDGSFCVRLAATMGHFLWQGAAVYVSVVLAGLLLRRASAQGRYAVFVGALVCMAASPLVTFMVLAPPDISAALSGGQSLPYGAGVMTVARSETDLPAIDGGQSPPYESEMIVPPLSSPVSLGMPPDPVVEKTDWWRYAPWLVACYCIGASVMFARLLAALCGGYRLRRRSEPVDDATILAAFARQARALGLRFAPAIAFCREVAVPTVVGVLRPMILLPLSAASGLTTEQIEVLLAHELAHIRRYDHLVNVFQRLIEAVLFFHPAVWFISRRIRTEREHCCDDMVLAVGGGRLAYAESLVRMAELSGGGGQSPPYMAAAAALGAADRPSQLRLRILRLISGRDGEQVRLLRPAALGLCTFLMLAAVACVHLASSRTDDRTGDVIPPGMAGTWFFENPMGDDEQMAVFPDGRVAVLYSNGHRDETRYADGTIELAEYGNVKAKLMLLPDGRTLQTSEQAQGVARLWQRIDAAPRTELLRPLSETPAEASAVVSNTQNGLRLVIKVEPADITEADTLKLTASFENVTDKPLKLFAPFFHGPPSVRDWRLIRADGVTFMPFEGGFQTAEGPGLQGKVREILPGRPWVLTYEVRLLERLSYQPGSPQTRVDVLTRGDYTVTFSYVRKDRLVPFKRFDPPGSGTPRIVPEQQEIEDLWVGEVHALPAAFAVQPTGIVSMHISGPPELRGGEGYNLEYTITNPGPKAVNWRGRFALAGNCPGRSRTQWNVEMANVTAKVNGDQGLRLDLPARTTRSGIINLKEVMSQGASSGSGRGGIPPAFLDSQGGMAEIHLVFVEPLGMTGTISLESNPLFLAFDGRASVSSARLPVKSLPSITVDEALARLSAGAGEARGQGAEQLVRLNDHRVVPRLLPLLGNENAEVRWRTAWVLASLADSGAGDALAEALSDPDARVRRFAGCGLGVSGNRSHVSTLVNALVQAQQSGRFDEALVLLGAIRKIQPEVPSEVITLVGRICKDPSEGTDQAHDPVSDCRWELCTALIECIWSRRTSEARDVIIQAWTAMNEKTQDYHTWYALRQMMSVVSPDRPMPYRRALALLDSVRTANLTDKEIRERWVVPLASLGNEALPELWWVLKFKGERDRDRRQVATQALSELGAVATKTDRYARVVNGLQLNIEVTPAVVDPGDTLKLVATIENVSGTPVRFFMPGHFDLASLSNWRFVRSDSTVFTAWPMPFRTADGSGIQGEILTLKGHEKRVLAKVEVRLLVEAEPPPAKRNWEHPLPPEPGEYVIFFTHHQSDNRVPFEEPETTGREYRPVDGLWIGKMESNRVRLTVRPLIQPSLRISASGEVKAGDPCPLTVRVNNPTDQPLQLSGGFRLQVSSMTSAASLRFRALPTPGLLADGEHCRLEVPAREAREFAIDAAVWPLTPSAERWQVSASRPASVHLYGAFRDVRTGFSVEFVGEDGMQALKSYPVYTVFHGMTSTLPVEGASERLEELTSLVSSSDGRIRQRAVVDIGKLRDPNGVPVLTTALNDSNWRVRLQAALALGVMPDGQAVGPLGEVLAGDDSTLVRAAAARALAAIGGDQAVQSLVTALRDDDCDVLKAVATALETAAWKPGRETDRLRYLLAARKWEDAAQVAPTAMPVDGARSKAQGWTDIDRPILVAVEAMIGRSGYRAETKWIEFSRDGDRMLAKLAVSFASGPKATWTASIELLDSTGRTLFREEADFENSGIIIGVPIITHELLRFGFGSAKELASATRFRVSLVERGTSAKVATSASDKRSPQAGDPQGVLNATVVIDAGHGGKDPGAFHLSEVPEKTITLDIARMLEQALAGRVSRVVMTRSDDRYVELDRRAAVADRERADLFISIHADASGRPERAGVDLHLATQGSYESYRIARSIEAAMAKGEILCNGISRNNYRVLTEHSRPGVMVGVGWLTNKADAARLKESAYRQKMAETIAAGIISALADRKVAADDQTASRPAAGNELEIRAIKDDGLIGREVTCRGVIRDSRISMWQQGEGGDFILEDGSGRVLVYCTVDLNSRSRDEVPNLRCIGFGMPTQLRNGDTVLVTGKLRKNPGDGANARPEMREAVYYVIVASEMTLVTRPTGSADEMSWGEAAEKVQCSLRTERTVWRTNEVPQLRARVRHDRPHAMDIVPGRGIYAVEIDGRWYVRRETGRGMMVSLPPQTESADIQCLLGRGWFRIAGDRGQVPILSGGVIVSNDELGLGTGRHAIRVAIAATPPTVNEGYAVTVVSNPVEIDIVETAGDEEPPAEPTAMPTSAGANQAEGLFKLDAPVTIALSLGDENRPKNLGYPVLRFESIENRLQAVLDVRFSSHPRTKWLMSIDLLDAAGKALDRAKSSHVTSGTIERVPHIEPAEIRFQFDHRTDPVKPARFRFSVQSVSTDQGNPLVFDKELPLELRLSTLENSNTVQAQSVRFEKSNERLTAIVRLQLTSLPKAKYRTKVEITDSRDRTAARAEQSVASSGMAVGYAVRTEETLRLDLGSTEPLEEASQPLRYVVWLDRVDEQADAATQPSPTGLRRTVLLPDGKPAVGAQVVLLLAEHEARFTDGRFDQEIHNRTERRPYGESAVTDANGQFTFPVGLWVFAVAILHDEGYVELPVARLTESPITLQPWARVEGVVLGMDKSKPGRPVDHLVAYRTYGRDGPGERGWQQENANINLRYSINPDSQGRFVLERVPPGQCVVRRVWVRPLTRGEIHQNAGEMRFETKSGQTTRVTVGATRRVVGGLLAAVDADFQIRPENTRIRYFLEAPPFFPDASGSDPVFNAYSEFLGSEAGKAFSGEVSPAPDGSFEIRDVPPARYFMQVRVLDQSGPEGKEGKVVGLVGSGFDLTTGTGNLNESPHDLGTIEVQPGEGSPKRDWGEAVEGVQCRLWIERTRLRIGESPRLGAGIRNRGDRELSVARSQELCELEVDDRWYRWAGEVDVKSSRFPPGGEFGGIGITLSPQWRAKDDGGVKLDLRPGRHTIRVAFVAQRAGRDGGEPIRVVSNPVEISIAAMGEAPVQTQPAAVEPIRLEGRWPEEAEADPTGRQTRIKVPAQTGNSMIEIRGLDFIVRKGSPRVDVDFQFRDGRTTGGELFEMTLLDKNKGVLATQRVLELRNREMPKEVFASFVAGGDDPPNRSGKAEFYFRGVSLTDIASFRLVVSEPGVAGLTQLLEDEDIYPRESAIRALGQLGSSAQPAVERLSRFLDDPNSHLRDTARQALGRIAH